METPIYFRDFSKGVVSHLPPTKLVDSASPRAFNTAFRAADGGSLLVGPRPGWRQAATLLDTALVITGHGFYHYELAGLTLTYQVCVTSDGRLWNVTSAPAVEIAIPTGTHNFATALIDGAANGVTFLQAKNRLLGVPINGRPFKIHRTSASSALVCTPLGIPTPAAPTYTGTAAGDLTGTIDVRVAWYNSDTDTEGSPSPLTSRSATAEALTFTLPTGAPSRVTHARVYVRKQELQSRFFRSAALQIAIATPTVVLNFTDAALNAMTLTPAPTEQGYDPPPIRVRAACWHLSRLFVTNGVDLFYSQPANPEQFDPASFELVSAGDGQLLMALGSLTDDALGCFKERSIWGMTGQAPATWRFTKLADVGTTSTRSVCEGADVWAFWSEQGPYVWKPGSSPRLLVSETLEPLRRDGTLLMARRDQPLTAYDPIGRRFLFGLDRSTTNNPWTIAPWSLVFECWEAIAWDLGPFRSLVTGLSTSAEPRIFLGGPGTLRELSQTLRRDGATEAAIGAVAFVAAMAGNALTLDRTPSVYGLASVARHISRATLAVHRGTYGLAGSVLTFDDPPTVALGDIVVFDGPVVEWDTVDTVLGAPSTTKRLLQSYAELWSSGDTPALLGMLRDAERVPLRIWYTEFRATHRDVAVEGPALVAAVQTHKRWAGFLAKWVRMRFVGFWPLTSWGLVHLGFSVLPLGDEDND